MLMICAVLLGRSPVVSAGTVTVRPGDTLSKIAARELKARGAEEGRRSSICWMCGGSFAGGRCREIQEIALEIGKQEQ